MLLCQTRWLLFFHFFWNTLHNSMDRVEWTWNTMQWAWKEVRVTINQDNWWPMTMLNCINSDIDFKQMGGKDLREQTNHLWSRLLTGLANLCWSLIGCCTWLMTNRSSINLTLRSFYLCPYHRSHVLSHSGLRSSLRCWCIMGDINKIFKFYTTHQL